MPFKLENLEGAIWVFNRTCSLLAEHWVKILRSVWALVLIHLLLDIAPFFLISNEQSVFDFSPIFFLFPLFLGALWVVIAVRIHRLLLTPEDLGIVPFGPMSKTESYFRFTTRAILFFIVFGFLFYLPFIVLFYSYEHGAVMIIALEIAAVLIAIYGLWLLAPLYLTLPSIAIRQVMNFHDVSRLSFDERILMFLVITVIPFVSILLLYALESAWENDHFYLLSLLSSIVYIVSLIVEVALLSVSFAYIMQGEHSENNG